MHAPNVRERQLAEPDFLLPDIRSVLVATDLSRAEDLALQRAWRIASAHGATVKLMYMPPRGQQVATAAGARLAAAASELEARLGLRVKTAPVKAHAFEDLLAQARGTDLVVLPHRRERSTAAFFRGRSVLRLLRGASSPVLVTRHEGAQPYRHILVPVDFSPASQRLVQLAASVDPHAALEVYHAISTYGEARLRAAEATDDAVRAYRERCVRHAQDEMHALAASLAGLGARLSTRIGRGDPGRQAVARQQRSGADLVVLGKRRSSAWEDFLCGSVAHRVLSWGSSDVLVVPPAGEPATARRALERLQWA